MKKNILVLIILIIIFAIAIGITYFLKDNSRSTNNISKIHETNYIKNTYGEGDTSKENNINEKSNLDEGEIIKFELRTSEYFSNMPKEYKYIINSEKELEKFYEIYSGKLNIDKNYLNDNTIFIEVSGVNSGSITKKLKEITFENNTVNFIIDTEYPEVGTDDMGFWYMVGIIPNNKLTNINTDNWIKPSDIK